MKSFYRNLMKLLSILACSYVLSCKKEVNLFWTLNLKRSTRIRVNKLIGQLIIGLGTVVVNWNQFNTGSNFVVFCFWAKLKLLRMNICLLITKLHYQDIILK